MKLLIITLVLSFLGATLASGAPTQIYTVCTSNAEDYYFYPINVPNGGIGQRFKLPDVIANVYGIFGLSSTGFYIINGNSSFINLYQYNIQQNSLQFVSYTENNFYQFSMQPLGYDDVNNIVYLSGGNTRNNNVTIFAWDFSSHQFNYIELPYQYNPSNIQSEGAYDPITGNFFIAYLDAQNSTHILTYNIPADFVISDNIIPQFNGNIKSNTFTELFFANGQLYIIEFTPLIGSVMYTVNIKNGAIAKVYSISSKFYYYDSGFVNNDQYIVFITSNAQNTVTYTTVDLNTYTQAYQTGNVAPVKNAYSLLLQ